MCGVGIFFYIDAMLTGLFETMKWKNGKIQLKDLHFGRLLKSLLLLGIELPQEFTIDLISDSINKLCDDKDLDHARIRLTVNLQPGNPAYAIDAEQLDNSIEFEDDLRIDIYPLEHKDCHVLAHLKSLPFVPYAKAAKYAAENDLSDCIVLNSEDRIADTSISNLFIIRNNILYTPPLSEGCIDGVMRRFLLSQLPHWKYECRERPLEIKDLINADEVFLTNSIRGIRSVQFFRDKVYDNMNTEQIVEKLKQTIPSTYC